MKTLLYVAMLCAFSSAVTLAQDCGGPGQPPCARQRNAGGNSERGQHFRKSEKRMPREAMLVHTLSKPEVIKKLKLTEGQQAKLTAKLQQFEDSQLDLKYKMEKAAMKQARLMTAKELDEDAIMNVIDEMGQYRTQMAKERMSLMIFVRKNLEPEQLEKMRGIMHERMRGRGKQHGGKHDKGRGRHVEDKRLQLTASRGGWAVI
jgi:Spy/CpxP family protein refolding chaperone